MSRAVALVARVVATLVRGARLAIGQPDYATYVAHLRERHPERPVPSREAFFREREQARYGRGRTRCC